MIRQIGGGGSLISQTGKTLFKPSQFGATTRQSLSQILSLRAQPDIGA